MNNIFATNVALHKRFDLKGSTCVNIYRSLLTRIRSLLTLIRVCVYIGSTLGRTASATDKKKGARAILKDLDLLEGGYKMKLGKARKRAFLDQIRSDCHLLMSLKIMDYSLLLGIHYREKETGLLHPGFANETLPLQPSAASGNVNAGTRAGGGGGEWGLPWYSGYSGCE